MSDGISAGYRAQRDAEERATRRWGHLTRGEARVKYSVYTLLADVLAAVEHFADGLEYGYRRDAEDIRDVMLQKAKEEL